MVDEIEKIKIPHNYEHTYTCPSCGAKITLNVEWGSNPMLEISMQPIVCPKCGTRLD